MKETIIGAVAVLALLVGGYAALAPKDVAPQPVGAVSGPDIPFPYIAVNGVAKYYNRKPFLTATTTVCAIKSPNATSTLSKDSGVRMNVSSTTASTVTLAKATTPFATTTLIGSSVVVAANAQADLTASTTAAQDAATVGLFAPNTYFVVGMAGGVGTFSPSGDCHADFTVL